MNRRGFLRLLAAIPVIRHVPLPRRIYGDGDLALTNNQTLSPHQAKQYWDSLGGGGGGGGSGGLCMIIKSVGDLKVEARGGGAGENTHESIQR